MEIGQEKTHDRSEEEEDLLHRSDKKVGAGENSPGGNHTNVEMENHEPGIMEASV